MKTDSTIPAQATKQPIEEPDVTKPVDTAVLEQRAKEARERLLKAVDALDEKRHHLTKPSTLIAAGVVPAAIVAGALIAAGSITAFAMSRRKRQRVITFARRPPPPSMLAQVARHVGLTVLTFAISEAGKVAVRKMLPSKGQRAAEKNQARRP